MRTAGILMPITSLPSPYGVGTLGQCACDFIQFYIVPDRHTGRYFRYVQQDMGIPLTSPSPPMPAIHI